MIQKAILVLVVISCLVACKNKDDDPPVPEPTKEELISAHAWKWTDIKANGNSILNSFPICITDNFYSFNANGSGLGNEGENKCDQNDPQIFPLGWEFASNKTKLVWYTVNSSDTFTLVSLSEGAMHIRLEPQGPDYYMGKK